MTKKDRQKPVPMTAAEFMAQLATSPDWEAKRAAAEVEQRTNRESYASGAQGVRVDLAAKGFAVETIGELKRFGKYESAVPVLVNWLPRVDNVAVKEDLVRTLSVPWARDAARALVAEFRNASDPALRWTIGNALEVVAGDEIADDMIAIATDPALGKAREMVVLGLARLNPSAVTDPLMKLLGDEEVVGHAVMALGRLRAGVARQAIAQLTRHPKAWVRKEAKAALAQMGA